MRKRFVLLAVVSIMTCAIFGMSVYNPGKAGATTAFQRVDFVDGVVTATQLNIRQGPAETYDVISVLNQGHTVKVFGKLGDWYAIYDPKSGTVGTAHGNYIKSAESGQSGNTSATTPAKDGQQQSSPSQNKNTNAQTNATTPKSTASAPANATLPLAGLLAEASEDEKELLNLINKARADAGLAPLVLSEDLQKTAELKAKDMVEKDYFSHQSPVYGSPFDLMRQYNITFKSAGETIAGNQSVEKAFDAWMGSPEHRANILNANFTATGISIQDGSPYGKIFVQQFIGK